MNYLLLSSHPAQMIVIEQHSYAMGEIRKPGQKDIRRNMDGDQERDKSSRLPVISQRCYIYSTLIERTMRLPSVLMDPQDAAHDDQQFHTRQISAHACSGTVRKRIECLFDRLGVASALAREPAFGSECFRVVAPHGGVAVDAVGRDGENGTGRECSTEDGETRGGHAVAWYARFVRLGDGGKRGRRHESR